MWAWHAWFVCNLINKQTHEKRGTSHETKNKSEAAWIFTNDINSSFPERMKKSYQLRYFSDVFFIMTVSPHSTRRFSTHRVTKIDKQNKVDTWWYTIVDAHVWQHNTISWRTTRNQQFSRHWIVHTARVSFHKSFRWKSSLLVVEYWLCNYVSCGFSLFILFYIVQILKRKEMSQREFFYRKFHVIESVS